MKITVITPTIRPEGLMLVAKALKKQTLKDFEWVIVSPLHRDIIDEHAKDFHHRYLREPAKQEGDVWSLNKAYNHAIKNSHGALIVSWQDFTFAKPDTLERFYSHFESEPTSLITAVGNKYSDETWTVETWRDPRITTKFGTFYSCYFNDIEWNLCAVPRKALNAVGGFDEKLDKWFGMDGYSVLHRLQILTGWDFKIDQSIQSFSLEHGRVPDWEEKNALHGPYHEISQGYIVNPVLDYLS